MSATNFCGSPYSGGMGMMPRRTRYVPASAGGADARRMLGGKWDLEQNTGTALDAAGRIWRQTFSFRPDREKPKTYLVFENLEQSLRVWLNGTYLGCGAAEYDISGAVAEGDNTLTVWLAGTRTLCAEAYLFQRPENHIRDYSVSMEIGTAATVKVRASFAGSLQPVSARILDREGAVAAQAAGSGELTMTIREPRLWDPADPYVYTLLLECCGERIRSALALRQVRVDGSRILLNGKALRLCGVSESRLTLKTENS